MIIPKHISLKRWGNQLNIDYPSDIVPVAPKEDNWKPWATSLVASKSFLANNVPVPTNEKSWQEWAYKFNQIMNQ